MTYSPKFHIPGSFVDHPPHTAPTLPISGVHPDVFRPPTSPSASSSAVLTKSTTVGLAGVESLVASHAAKRKRGSEIGTRENTPTREWNGAVSTWEGDASRRYVLAGQIDTPGSRRAAVVDNGGIHVGRSSVEECATMEESVYSDVGYRRALGPDGDAMMDSPSGLFGPVNVLQPPTPSSAGWSRIALGAIGGVVGKVWEFCKAGAFKGFIAGGGKAYAVNGEQVTELIPNGAQNGEHALEGGAFVPGGFPSHEYASPYPDTAVASATPDSTPSRPAAKRRQVREVRNDDELGRNWVMVGDPAGDRRRRATGGGAYSNSTATRSSHSRRSSRNMSPSVTTGRRINVPVPRLSTVSTTPSFSRRHSHRVSHAGSPSLSVRQPASYAGPRPASQPSPPAPSPSYTPLSPSRIPVPSARMSSSQPGHRRTNSSASSASPRRSSFRTDTLPKAKSQVNPMNAVPVPRLDPEAIESSPRLDPEAKQLATRKLKEERDADARIAAFNARLRDMIREGKEALGTTVEVDIEGDDGGWMDED
ncbi:hypothetical protein jhhlp_005994 [Lomentospora prolificans]|uniref:Uncharacterized protein n=1 Tax=Lomentospora prolificans TaxID=41688 RepID=A0A2N3N4R6_9PEZI|nr:hypothetical protein jhhlp_005994 [Lomentospora prolificans]